MRFPPVSVVATWPPANYVNPATRGTSLLIVELIFLPLALICLVMRLYVRLHILRRSWWDDWLMAGAAVFACGVTVCVCLATQKYGWDLHIWDVKLDQLIAGRKISIAGQTLFVFASGLAKLSILTSYLRIAPLKSKFRLCTWSAIVLVCSCMVTFLIVLWTQCIPATSYWDLFDNNRHCIEEGPPLMGQIATTIATDFITYILPMPTLFYLNLPLAQRIGLMVVFGFGSIVVAAGCMRLYYTHLVVYETYDVTWVGFNLWIWTAVEVNLGIICGCIPALKPLAYRARSRFSSYAKSSPFGSSRSRSQKSRPTELEMEEDASIVDRSRDTVASTTYTNDKLATSAIDEDIEHNGASFNATKPLDDLGTQWFDDPRPREERHSWQGLPGFSSSDITRNAFGLNG